MVRRVLAVGACSAVLALAACSSSGGASNPQTSSSSTAAATTSAAPSASGSASGSATSQAAAPTKAQLRTKLLTVDELPAGWAVDNSGDDSSDDSSDEPACLKKIDQESKTLDASDVQRTFDGSDGVTQFDEELTYVPASQLSAYESAIKAVDSCTTFSMTVDGMTIKGTLGKMSYPKIGDETHAYKMDMSAKGMDFTMDVVMIREGTTMASFDIFAESGQPALSELSSLIDLGVKKLTGQQSTGQNAT